MENDIQNECAPQLGTNLIAYQCEFLLTMKSVSILTIILRNI